MRTVRRGRSEGRPRAPASASNPKVPRFGACFGSGPEFKLIVTSPGWAVSDGEVSASAEFHFAPTGEIAPSQFLGGKLQRLTALDLQTETECRE